MKKWIAILLAFSMVALAGCGSQETQETTGETQPAATLAPLVPVEVAVATDPQLEGEVTDILLNGKEVTVQGDSEAVTLSNDIIYYEDRDTYDSGNPYGEGGETDRHSTEEAAAHLVVNITKPGNYRLSGELTLGQIRIDLGEDAYEDPTAVVNLILDNAQINCTVAPAILFLNVYECDGNWSTETATPEVDTSAAGANLILAQDSRNVVNGSYVARIYKDKEGEKKLWKQDGAIYSYMSMNVAGTGTLDLYAENEGLDTELHLTINSGNLNIWADNDGINTNEDGVSVTTINGGNLHIIAGLGAEGDGVDSNGYLVINGGTVVASANPAADAGLDSDLGSYINGGTVIALGSTMDWAESDSDQVTMNLQFASMQSSGSAIAVTREDGTVVFAYDPGADEVLGENTRQYMGAIISCPYFTLGESYYVYLDAQLSGTETGGVYDIFTLSGLEGGVQQAYTGTDAMMGMGGKNPFGGGQRPDGDGSMGNAPEMPEGGNPFGGSGQPGEMPEGFTMPEGDPGEMRGDSSMPAGNPGEMRGDSSMPAGEPGEIPEDFTMPEGQEPPDGFGQKGEGFTMGGTSNTLFYMLDKVNFFSGVAAVSE